MKRSSKQLTTQNKNSVTKNSILTSIRKFSLVNQTPLNLTMNYSPEKKESAKRNKSSKLIITLPNQIRSELLDYVDKEIKTKIKKGGAVMDNNRDYQLFVVQENNNTHRNSSKSTTYNSISPTKCCSSKNGSSISVCSYNTLKIDYEKIMRGIPRIESKLVLLDPKQKEKRSLYQYKLEAIADARKMSLINNAKKNKFGCLSPSHSTAEISLKCNNTIESSLLELNPMQIQFPSLDLNQDTSKDKTLKNNSNGKIRKQHNYSIQISFNQ